MLKIPSLNNLEPADVIAFWTNPNQADLLRCLWPTGYKATGNVGPIYPKGGFHPGFQALTAVGLATIMGRQKRNVTVDGFSSYLANTDPVLCGKIAGLCIKPIDAKIVLMDIDFDVMSTASARVNTLVTALIDRGAMLVQGNPQRLTIIMRQSEALRQYLAEEYPGRSKLILGGSTVGDQVEISIREGAAANIWGKHKSGIYYKSRLPDNFRLGTMSLKGFLAAMRVWKAEGFEFKSTNTSCSTNRLTVSDMIVQYADRVRTIRDQLQVVTRFNPSYKMELRSLLSPETVAAIEGRKCVTTGWRSAPGYIPDGARRLTTWYVGSDLVNFTELLIELGVDYDESEVEALIAEYAKNVQYDRQLVSVFVPGYDVPQMVNKWGHEYIAEQYSKIAERDDVSVAMTYALPMMHRVSNQLMAEITKINERTRSRLNKTLEAA